MDVKDLDMLGMNLTEVGTEPTNIVKNCNDKSSRSDDYSYKSAEVGTDCISRALPSAQPELSAEDIQLIKRLRSYHNGSYAKVIDKLIAPRVADAVDMQKGGKNERNDPMRQM